LLAGNSSDLRFPQLDCHGMAPRSAASDAHPFTPSVR
jgi:hypothetical protein